MTATPAAPASLAEALAALQAQMPVVAKQSKAEVTSQRTGGKYTYSYAPGEDITAKLYPVMAPLGLSFSAKPTMHEVHGFVLAYSLKHVSGEHDDGLYPLPDPARLGPQDLGKAETYARRYALCAIIGLFPGGDDTDATTGGQPIDATARKIERRIASADRNSEVTRKPRNVPDAQLAAEGRMTRAQAAEHAQLEKDVRGRRPGERADRVRPSEPDPGDPWAADQPVTRNRARDMRDHLDRDTQPEDRPGSILPGQHRAIEAQLSMLGFKPAERADRHGHAALRLNLDALPPRPDAPDGGPSLLGLSAAQAAELIHGLQDDLDDLKKADADA